MTVNGSSFEFSDGFTELHTNSYKDILNGTGFCLSEARPAIEIVHQIRISKPIGKVGDYHPFVNIPLTKHPFQL